MNTLNKRLPACAILRPRFKCAQFVWALLVAWCTSTNLFASGPAQPIKTRCGWFENPTPQNASLLDRDGEWVLSVQGGHQAKGNWPMFKASQWVRTNVGSYGYGCACLKVQTATDSVDVTRIVSSYAKPLSACRKDKALKDLEPENPLK